MIIRIPKYQLLAFVMLLTVIVCGPGCSRFAKRRPIAEVPKPVQAESVSAIHNRPDLNIPTLIGGRIHSQPRTNLSELPAEFLDLSLDEAIQIALSDTQILRTLGATALLNSQGTASSLDPSIVSSDPTFGIEAALAQFDARFASTLNHQKNDDVFNNPVLGGNAQEVRDDVSIANYTINKISGAGTQFSITSDIRHSQSNSPGLVFPHSWQTTWEATIRHPLLQGNGVQFNQIAGPALQPGIRNSSGVVISRINHQISRSQFERQLRDMVQEIINAYWSLDLAYKNFESTKELRDASLTTWNLTKTRFDTDLEGGEADREAQAREQYYQFETLLLNAVNGSTLTGQLGIYQAEADLRRLLNLPQSDEKLIRPLDKPIPVGTVYDWDELAKVALNERIEIQEQMWRIKQRQLELIAARNFTLPRLDAIATYRNNGFGDDLTGGGSGRFSSAVKDAFSNDHGEWELGIAYNMTIGYRQAHSGVQNAELNLRREKAVLKEQESQLLHDLGSAIRQVNLVFQEIELNQLRVDAATSTVDARTVGFESDVVGFDELLDAQQRLLQSKLQYQQALSNFEISKANLLNQSGKLLSEYGIRFADSDVP